MKKLPRSYLEPKIFDNKYIIKNQLSSGSFGVVYLAIHKITREEVAVKLEKGEHETLDREVYLLTKLQGIQGITKLYWFGAEQNYNVMVVELLGKDLGYYSRTYKQLSLKTGLQLLDQLLTIFKQVHSRGIVHRDLKPENIMMGKQNTSIIYLVDFGVSKSILDKGRHIPFKDKKSFIGTTRYASIAAHKGFEISRKDDLESMMYVIIYLILGKLPWQNLQNIGDKDRTVAVGEVKMSTSIDTLCKELPIQFADYLKYLKILKFEDQPDYDMLKTLMKKCSNSITYDNLFEWSDKQQNKESQLEVKIQGSFLLVPGNDGVQRSHTKKQSNVSNLGSSSSNIVKYVPSFQDAVQFKQSSQTQIKIAASQPQIDFNKLYQTIDFDDIEENMNDHPTLEQKYLNLQGFDAKFKDEKIQFSRSAINVFEQ
ncbi:unnamed protein product [Paramecium primaurelia]|uniref:Casein kinase I n=1 Tax=Paramecium primaurelia TaxID=5886 RepID=A0A8S1KSW6_PARPR|nr:unnamed protein product [Paramecium primaurelia]